MLTTKRGGKSKLKKIEIPDNADKEILKKVIESQFKYSRIGYIVGVTIIIFGILITFFGIYYPLSKVTIKIISLSFSVNNATPGIILFIIGFLVIITTRFSVKVKKTKANNA